MYNFSIQNRQRFELKNRGDFIEKNGRTQGMEDNLKRAVTEMLVLTLLKREDLSAIQITQRVEEESGRVIGLVSPYMLFYRLIENGCIIEAYKKIAPDGRRRQYYQITDEGKKYLAELVAFYQQFISGVASVLGGEEEANGE